MSLNRRAAKRDANEPEIIRELVARGCLVMQLGKFDLLVRLPNGKQLRMLEVKSKGGRVEPSQQTMIQQGWPLHIVYSVGDALEACGIKT